MGENLWRRSGERYNPNNVLDLRTSGRLTLGYWGWMSSMGPGELVEIGGRMNSERYLEVLKDVMLPSVRVAYPEGQIYLVHDNSSVHKSKIVKDWLNSQKDITATEDRSNRKVKWLQGERIEHIHEKKDEGTKKEVKTIRTQKEETAWIWIITKQKGSNC
ncbi:hypothetical protein MSG28_009265 [Choristoneura fumiferana]|uniref:Uncharacterized protein n=1 Tax=Choristoneura fumiferana TaxID=7141 RepID=A0ACC0KWV7_CHOFU|nr:hypothetical protein MSG28_009265 [Choristoneura fumiferana]